MNDQRYEFLAAAHEMIEAYLALHAGCHQRPSTSSTGHTKPNAKPGTTASPATIPRRPIIANTCLLRRSSAHSPNSSELIGRSMTARCRASVRRQTARWRRIR